MEERRTDRTRAYFRPSEAKDVIGVSRATIYNWQKRGLITIHKVSGMAFVSMEECRELIEKR